MTAAKRALEVRDPQIASASVPEQGQDDVGWTFEAGRQRRGVSPLAPWGAR